MSRLETERLRLTPMGPEDFDFLFQLWNEPRFCAVMGVEPMSTETVWMRLLRDIGHWQVMGFGNWLVRLKDGTPIGSMGIFEYRRDMLPLLKIPELGWGFDFDFHGRGYGSEALKAALGFADRTLGAIKTGAIIAPTNGSSQALAQKGGFVFAGEGQFQGKSIWLYERQAPLG